MSRLAKVRSVSSILMRIESNRLCLVTGLPASRVISTKNPAYNGGVFSGALQTRCIDGKIIPWEVVSKEIDPITTYAPLASGA